MFDIIVKISDIILDFLILFTQSKIDLMNIFIMID